MTASVEIGLAITVGLAVLGYVVTYLNSLRLSRRQDNLQRVNAQLSDFYGPLLALLTTTNLVYARWRETEFRLATGWSGASDADKDQWRLWMSTVFMPLNQKMVDIIITRAHLVEQDYMPPQLLTLCAHVSGYEVLIKRWGNGDYSRMVPYIVFPGIVIDYVEKSFAKLKERQASLLGRAEAASDGFRTIDDLRRAHPEYFRDAHSTEPF